MSTRLASVFVKILLSICILLLFALVLEGAWRLSPQGRPKLALAKAHCPVGPIALEIAARRAGVEIVDAVRGDAKTGSPDVDCPLASPAEARCHGTQTALFLLMYSPEVFEKAKFEKLAFCRELRVVGDEAGGAADVSNGAILITVDSGDPKHKLLHELFHSIDLAMLRDGEDDGRSEREWTKLNPPGFQYGPPARDEARPLAFVNTYATTSALEDRASVYEWMAAYPSKTRRLIRDDAYLAAKVALVRRRLRAFHPSFDDAFWHRVDEMEDTSGDDWRM